MTKDKNVTTKALDEIVDSLFVDNQEIKPIQQNEQIQYLPPVKLIAFENHPFKVEQDGEFNKLLDSVRENGILIPLIARPKGDKFELIAGHRRKLAAVIAGLETLPVLVRELSDEQSVIAMVDSNVQRENILPSEKAFAYKMKLEAVKRQAKRSDFGSAQVGQQAWSVNIVAENTGESRNQIQRYIRLTELNPQILKMVDEKRIAFNPAVEISYLPQEQQLLLLSVMEAEQTTPTLAQAQKLKAICNDNALDEPTILEVMREQKANQKELVKIPYDKVREVLNRDMAPKELEDFILKAVVDYDKRLRQRQQNRDAR